MRTPALLAFMLAIPACWAATPSLPAPAAIFTDHMVLQRDRPIPVWGRAVAGSEVSVSFAGQTRTARADASGGWKVEFDALPANKVGREMVVRAPGGGDAVSISDIVVGDVWLCSGQSNMHFRMSGVENAGTEIRSAANPLVRFFNVREQFGRASVPDVAGEWLPLSPETAAKCSAVACYFGLALQSHLDVPIGLVNSSVGGTRIESWMRPRTLADTGESRSLVAKWEKIPDDQFEKIAVDYRAFQYQRDQAHPKAVRAARERGEPLPPAPVMPKIRCHDCPGALHHGMIEPLEPMRIRGVIWYQGESNSGQPQSYRKLLPALIADWREVWGKDLPFLFVQLAPHRNTHPAFREAQQRIWESTPRTGMAVTLDVGDPANIHPRRKRPVGERLALCARAIAHGEQIPFSGPVFKSMRVEKTRAIIDFVHTGSGLVAKDGALTGFEVAGADGKFHPATAAIEGLNVVVSSERVTAPAAVRYAWAMAPQASLFNREGLPALPFRTDGPDGDDAKGASDP